MLNIKAPHGDRPDDELPLPLTMHMLSSFLTREHHHCDDLFADAENAVVRKSWSEADALYSQFFTETQAHFGHEEDTLFPALEAKTGMTHGPTEVMRMEHKQMNEVLAAMHEALAKREDQTYLGLSETLLMLMQQHNMKEEMVLYPMADNALAGEEGGLLQLMGMA